MAGVEEVERTRGAEGKAAAAAVADEEKKGRFKFVRYERSSDVVSVRDSSVSYVSAFAAARLIETFHHDKMVMAWYIGTVKFVGDFR